MKLAILTMLFSPVFSIAAEPLEGIEPLVPQAEKTADSAFAGRTMLTSGLNWTSGQEPRYFGGLAWAWSPRLSLFTETISGSSAGEGAMSLLGLEYQGLALGDWNLGFSGRFQPEALAMGEGAGEVSEISRRGYGFTTSISRDWGGLSTVFSFGYQDGLNRQFQSRSRRWPWSMDSPRFP